MHFYKMLIRQKYIRPNDEHDRAGQLHKLFKGQLQRLQEAGDNVDTDTNPASINGAFLLSVFAAHFQLGGVIKSDVYRLAYGQVTGQPLDLTKNRHLLGKWHLRL